ncbi:MAG TPA: hypothetical protein VNS34_08610 [Rhizobiaceae bacterium]|nr:hypothetical protein [Rhizobiaceae bacterium]
MLIYGDLERRERPAAIRRSFLELVDAAQRGRTGIERHATLVVAFLLASEFVQGIADAEAEQRGCDGRSPRQDAGSRLLLVLARAIDRSRGTRRLAPLIPAIEDLLPELDWQEPVRLRRAEGYAFYALYPESYLAAARRSGLGPETRVVGIRSIGTGLSALVAAALGAAPPVTVRPIGHPFQRRLEVAPELTIEMAERPDLPCAVVDEGPGLSGSSFAAVADWLERCGTRRKDIHFFPSHEGEPGSRASDEIRKRWREAPRHVVGFDTLFLMPQRREDSIAGWVTGLIGPLDCQLQDISGGGWRRLARVDETSWLPADGRFERRKFLAVSDGCKWLVKFAGLGEDGARKLRVAQSLAEAGLGPEVAGLRYGFIVQRWVDGEAPSKVDDRTCLVAEMARYLAFRASRFETSLPGASLERLAQMASHNIECAIGPTAAARYAPLLRDGLRLESKIRRIDSDNRLHAWEWVRRPGGQLIKADALDHSAGHDLIGAQDVAWDIAGAAVEHDLSRNETAELCLRVSEGCGRPVDPDLLAVFKVCYLAFQLGLWTTSAEAAVGAEQARLLDFSRRYREALECMT